jgi:hypothetical protein
MKLKAESNKGGLNSGVSIWIDHVEKQMSPSFKDKIVWMCRTKVSTITNSFLMARKFAGMNHCPVIPVIEKTIGLCSHV